MGGREDETRWARVFFFYFFLMLEKELEGKHDETTQQAVHNAISRRKTRTHTQNAFAILEDNTRREGGRKKDQTNKSTTLAMQLAMGW